MRSPVSLFTCTSYAYNNAPVTSVLEFLLIFCSAEIPTGISYVPFPRPIDECKSEYSKAFFLPSVLSHIRLCLSHVRLSYLAGQ
jgi:hypothetical protein